jgi:hypothetical protein
VYTGYFGGVHLGFVRAIVVEQVCEALEKRASGGFLAETAHRRKARRAHDESHELLERARKSG